MPESNPPQLDLFDWRTNTTPVRRSLGEGGSDTFWHGLQVERDFPALAKDREKLTSGIKPADQLITTHP